MSNLEAVRSNKIHSLKYQRHGLRYWFANINEKTELMAKFIPCEKKKLKICFRKERSWLERIN